MKDVNKKNRGKFPVHDYYLKEKHFDSLTATDRQLQVGQFKGLQSVG